jgi:hypothetical protein
MLLRGIQRNLTWTHHDLRTETTTWTVAINRKPVGSA